VRAGQRRRPAAPRRADRRARPAHGDGVPELHPRGPRRGQDGPAVQPHPRAGGGARRPHLDHPARADRGDGHADRDAAPHPHDRHRHHREGRPCPGRPARRPQPERGERAGPLRRGRRSPARGRPPPRGAGRPEPHRAPADPGATAAAPLRRRAARRRRRRDGRDGVMTAATVPASAGGLGDGLAGTGTLLRFMLRRDRVRFPAWTLGLALLMGYFTTVLGSVYTTTEELEAVTAFSASPAGALFGGPGHGYDAITLERFLAGQYGLYIMLGAALMALLTVTRHTRAEERSGRAELVRANVVGRSAQLTAALTLTALMCVAAAVLVAGVLLAAG